MFALRPEGMSYRSYAYAGTSSLNKPSPSNFVEEPLTSAPPVDKYKAKYKRIKKIVKNFIFENAALCDQIAALQERTILLIEERNFLFRKLQQYQPYEVDQTRMLAPSFEPPPPRKAIGKKRASENPPSCDTPKPRIPKKTAARKKKIVKSIPLDMAGKPIFPIALGDFVVHSIGEVCEKPEFHTDDLIFPVGYCSTRIYGSLKDPEKQCLYTCKVMDSGTQGPRFEIVSDTDLDVPLVSSSIDACHSMLLSLINMCLGCEVVNTKGRGADFFGISHPTIHYLIQSSPGVRKCKGYVWTKFEINPNYEYVSDETEASLSYNALLRSISFSKSHLESMKSHHANEYVEEATSLRSLLLN